MPKLSFSFIKEHCYFEDTAVITFDRQISLLSEFEPYFLYPYPTTPLLIQKEELADENISATKNKIKDYLNKQKYNYHENAELISQVFHELIKKAKTDKNLIKKLIYKVANLKETDSEAKKLEKTIDGNSAIESSRIKLSSELKAIFEKAFKKEKKTINSIISEAKSLLKNISVSDTTKNIVVDNILSLKEEPLARSALEYALNSEGFKFILPSSLSQLMNMNKYSLNNLRINPGVAGFSRYYLRDICVPLQFGSNGQIQIKEFDTKPRALGGTIFYEDMGVWNLDQFAPISFKSILIEELRDYFSFSLRISTDSNDHQITNSSVFYEAYLEVVRQINFLQPIAEKISHNKFNKLSDKEEETWKEIIAIFSQYQAIFTPSVRVRIEKLSMSEKLQLGDKIIRKDLERLTDKTEYMVKEIITDPIISRAQWAVLQAAPIQEYTNKVYSQLLFELVQEVVSLITTISNYDESVFTSELFGKLPNLQLKFPGMLEKFFPKLIEAVEPFDKKLNSILKDLKLDNIDTELGEFCLYPTDHPDQFATALSILPYNLSNLTYTSPVLLTNYSFCIVV